MRNFLPGLAAVAALLVLPRDAAAYIDPGTGSLILQGLIGAFAVAAVTIRGYWYRIKAFFRRDKPAAESTTGNSRPGEPHGPGGP